MNFPSGIRHSTAFLLRQTLACSLLISTAIASEPCGLCDKEVVTNSTLATCFLEKFDSLAGKTGGAIVIDLSDCEESRGIVDALRLPGAAPKLPTVRFILSPDQLTCLKTKLEEPELVLDPEATIELDDCS